MEIISVYCEYHRLGVCAESQGTVCATASVILVSCYHPCSLLSYMHLHLFVNMNLDLCSSSSCEEMCFFFQKYTSLALMLHSDDEVFWVTNNALNTALNVLL